MHRLDTETQIFFYENEFYVFSNFSAFTTQWKGKLYPTSEQAYQAERYEDESTKELIRTARSAHEAFVYAMTHKDADRKDWDDVRVSIMKDILRAKVEQHPYVKQKLLESGTKELIEDSWRDDFWGWGPNKDGKNQLGKLWMELRSELRAS